MRNNVHDSSAPQIALLTVCLDQSVSDRVRSAANELECAVTHLDFGTYLSAARRPHLTKQVIDAHACIAVVDFDADPEAALETAEFIRNSFYHKVAIVALSSSTDPDLLLRAMRAGYSDFIGKPFQDADFCEMAARLAERLLSSVSRPQRAGRIISFFGAKGGVGTTLLAVHLATYLVRLSSKKVLLIDNHSHLGHVSLYLGLDGTNHHFHELVRNISRLDEDLLRGFIASHPSGLDVLSSPDVHGEARSVDAASVERTLEFLSTQYDYILLDCDSSFEETNLAIVDLSTLVYLIATPEIGAIRDLSRYVDGLVQNETVLHKLQVVINRYSSREAVTIEQIEKAVRLPIAFKISNSYTEAVRSINVGEPLTPDRKSDLALQLMKWASLLAGNDDLAASPGKKRFALWK